MDTTIPNIDWCRKISISLNVSTRCPFATVNSCPRFYQSLSLSGSSEHTKISQKKDLLLQKKWEKSELWPLVPDQASSVFGSKKRQQSYSKFCPEVSFDSFGYFASELYSYSDEQDLEYGTKMAIRGKISSEHWKYNWSHVTKMHYTDCPLYSPLNQKISNNQKHVLLFDKLQNWAKNNPIIVFLLVLSGVTVLLGSTTDALTKLQILVQKLKLF